MKSTARFILVATLSSLIPFLAACDGADGRKVKYLEKGKANIEAKNYAKAKVELKNVIQIDPKYAEAYFLLGTVAEAEQNWRNAMSLYTKAVELDENNLDAQASLGRFFLLQRKTREATEIAELILKKAPAHRGGRLLKAGVLHHGGNTLGAINISQKLIEEDPSDIQATLFLSGIYIKKENIDNARDILEQSIAKNPQEISLRSLLARVYASNKDNNKAEEQLRKIISIEPDTLVHRVTLASFFFNIKEFAKAEQTLRDAIQANPDDAPRYLQLAELLAQHKGPEAAEKELISAINAKPELADLKFGLAKLYLKSGKRDNAEKLYNDIIKQEGTEPQGLTARNRLAAINLELKKVAEAKQLSEEVLKENPRDNDALLVKGKIALYERDARTAIGAFRTILKDRPGSSEVSALLSDAHIQIGEKELARETLYNAVESNPKDERLRITLARFMINEREFDNAIEILDLIPADSENISVATQLKIDARLYKGDVKSVLETVKAIKKANPNDGYAYFKLGQIYLAQKKYGDAFKELSIAVKKKPDNIGALTAYVKAGLNDKKTSTVLKQIKAAEKRNPGDAHIQTLFAEIYFAQKKYDLVEKALQKAIALKPKWDVPYGSLAKLDILQGKQQAAIGRLKQGLEANPGNLNLTLRMASTYEMNNDVNSAIELYESVLRSKPENATAVNNLAALLIDNRTDPQSIERAKQLAVRLKSANRPALMDTLGWIYHKTGDSQSAVNVLRKVVEKAPGVPVFHYHLGMAYSQLGDNIAAKKHLKKALEGKQDYPGKDIARSKYKQLK